MNTIRIEFNSEHSTAIIERYVRQSDPPHELFYIAINSESMHTVAGHSLPEPFVPSR